MTTHIVGPNRHDSPDSQTARPWISRAYLALAFFLVWLPLMFALGYVVTSWFDVDPSAGETITSHGLVGWLTAIGYAVLVGLPGWFGAWAAWRAQRICPSSAATVAMALAALAATGLLVLCLVVPL